MAPGYCPVSAPYFPVLHTCFGSRSGTYKKHLRSMPLLHCILPAIKYSLIPDTHSPSCCYSPQMPVGYHPSQHNGIRFPVLRVLPDVLLSPKSVTNGWLPYLPYTLPSDRLHRGHYPESESCAVLLQSFLLLVLNMVEILLHIQTVHFLREYNCVRFPDTGTHRQLVHC